MNVATTVVCTHSTGYPPEALTLSTCPRCRGKGFYHAWNLLPTGRVGFVSGYDALAQSIVKIFTEKMRTSGYGFDYQILLAVDTSGNLEATVRGECFRVIEYLLTVQQQVRSEGFSYLPTEEIALVDDIQVTRDVTDPRQFRVVVFLTTTSGIRREVSTLITR